MEHSDPEWAPPADETAVLVEANFTKFINKYDLSLVEFYAPWLVSRKNIIVLCYKHQCLTRYVFLLVNVRCGHCKKMAPEYSRAAKVLKEAKEPIMLAKVDATEEPSLATKYGATGYPSLKMFRKGKAYEYKGPRDERGKFTRLSFLYGGNFV